MIFVTGDIHGDVDIRKFNRKFVEGRNLSKNDYVICTGDFGLIWDVNESKETEKHWTDWLTEKSWTTLFVDGNHENFDRLFALPEVEMFGAKVGVVNDSIFHLKRGEIYTIDDNKIFTFGGAQSQDKMYRKEGISWWPQEIPSYAEMQKGLDTLEQADWTVDYILTHTCPKRIAQTIVDIDEDRMKDPVVEYLDHIFDLTQFKMWYFGHMHIDRNFGDKLVGQYETIVELGKHISAGEQSPASAPMA